MRRHQIKCTMKPVCLPAAFAACYQKHVKWYSLLIFAILWICTALSFFMLPEVSLSNMPAGPEALSWRQRILETCHHDMSTSFDVQAFCNINLSHVLYAQVVKPQIFRVPLAPIVCSCTIFGGVCLYADPNFQHVSEIFGDCCEWLLIRKFDLFDHAAA